MAAVTRICSNTRQILQVLKIAVSASVLGDDETATIVLQWGSGDSVTSSGE